MNELVKKSDGPTGRRTATKAVRRQQLIEATIDSIARHGIGGTTMSTVTEGAGLSLGLVNFHFKTKQNLFEETLLYLAREHHEQWKKAHRAGGLSAADMLEAIVVSHFHPRICTQRKLSVWFAFYGEAGRRDVYRSLIEDIDTERFRTTIALIEAIQSEGGYGGPAARQVALGLESLYDGMWLNILLYPGDYTRTAGKDHVMAYLVSLYPRHFETRAPDARWI